jgi:hypothetical protein
LHIFEALGGEFSKHSSMGFALGKFLKYLYFEWDVVVNPRAHLRLTNINSSVACLECIEDHSSPRSFDRTCSLGGGSWVSESWVGEFSIMIFLVEGSLGLLSHGDEVGNKDWVREVGVGIILEVLNLVHLGLDALVSSDSWEREGSVKKFPSVNLCWLNLEFGSNSHGVLVVLDIEFSRELIHLPGHLVLGDPESLFTSTLGWGEGINDTSIILKGDEVINRWLGGRDGSDKKECNKGWFHIYKKLFLT